ncbi:MerR family transcriptional regulator [Acetobacterium woodii]|uniref:Transcriptional activator TipA n=1 Tax=Acetobacterium woodii (strain ATCC 29683 / DSM 1030 / JCM 2381 / KCTC 1655 / WB1) TaxID=931626 RepID=H6LGN6_ACEWD|nr:MerR family transcriptional regulator [Acetobacterium woodii]AFA48364.1 transcriptional activator TipA [Acetobacterium woodii DSM 1030]
MKMTVKEVATLTGISVRTLHYYHREGILIPSEISENKYRYYNEENLKLLHTILFLRELDFSIQEIKRILADPNYDEINSFKKQRHLLMLKRSRLDKLIALLENKIQGEMTMNFKPFDMKEIEENKMKYKSEVSERWGNSDAYHQSEQKTNHYSPEVWEAIHNEAEAIYAGFVNNMNKNAADLTVQDLVAQWQGHITKYYYECTKEILAGLGLMYSCDERFKTNIDEHAPGLAQFMSDAIAIYTSK